MDERKHAASPYLELEEVKLSAAFCELALEESAGVSDSVKDMCDAAHERLLKKTAPKFLQDKVWRSGEKGCAAGGQSGGVYYHHRPACRRHSGCEQQPHQGEAV